ncbi:alpha-2-macroglobulin-like protein [Plakobranchus ocellatus]|uniref:Alpha-2-macroglobulin-like protein n=1 Tax=Plakobranchus ocellatus TaxID=259542 RepID=A0AAV4C6S4_9GAST|nr:alpha-2-macroglobulin-like protein [Plakobranchus ocellatus]
MYDNKSSLNRDNPKLCFLCTQVIARERVVITGQIDPTASAKRGLGLTMPSTDMCMDREEDLIIKELHNMSGRSMPDSRQFPQIKDKEPQKRDDDIKPVVRSAIVSDMVFNFQLPVKIERIMSSMFTLLLFRVTEDGEMVADSKHYYVEPCFENEIFDKIEETTHPRHGPNTHVYKNYDDDHCLEQVKSEGVTVNKSEEWRYTSLYVDSIEAFRKEEDCDSDESNVDENHGHALNDLMRESIEEPIENLVLDLEASPSSTKRPNDQVYEGEHNVYRSRSSCSASSRSRNDQAEGRRIVRRWVKGRSRERGPRNRGGTGQRRGMGRGMAQQRSNLVENWEVAGPDACNDISFIGEPGISAETENFTPTDYFELFSMKIF